MLRIGITGGIGTGKSTVCRIFELLGIPVFYADQEARRLLEEDATVIEAVKNIFGDSIYEDGKLRKKQVADIVFHDTVKLAQLNAISHPAVRLSFESWALQQINAPYVLKEAALIYETGGDALLDAVIAVTAPEALRIDRIVKRDQVPEKDIRARMLHQWPEEDKIRRSAFVISNDEQLPVIPQVLAIHKMLLQRPTIP
ncbi:MAG: dephospho-CoA kinase [Chitinophagales bacterium]|nr:dephospho-CoA kinase [Chitinophagales bacterium]